jgi:hypothetical protein
MREEMRDFLTKAGAYTLTPMSQMLRLATRVPGLSDPPSMRKVYRLGQGEPDRMTPARRKVIETLVEYGGLGFTLSELSGLAGVSTSVIKGLAAQGVVEEADTPARHALPAARPRPPGQGPDGGSGGGGGGAARRDPYISVWNDASEGRHRVGQDRGVSRGRGGMPCARGGRRWSCCRKSR